MISNAEVEVLTSNAAAPRFGGVDPAAYESAWAAIHRGALDGDHLVARICDDALSGFVTDAEGQV